MTKSSVKEKGVIKKAGKMMRFLEKMLALRTWQLKAKPRVRGRRRGEGGHCKFRNDNKARINGVLNLKGI